MIIFVFGEDGYRSQEKVRVMRDAFKEKFDAAGMNLLEVDLREKLKLGRGGNVLGEVMQAVQSPPFLRAKRMVVVRGLLEEKKKKADAAPWVTAFERVPESTIVILWSGMKSAAVKKHSFFKAFDGQEGVHSYAFDVLQGAGLNGWAREYVAKIGGRFDDEALRMVVSTSGGELWMLRAEIDKLCAYAGGEAVTREMVDLLGGTRSDDVIFALMDGLVGGDSARVLGLLDKQRGFGAADIYLMTMIARQVRLLMNARAFLDGGGNQRDAAKVLGLHPFVASKTVGQARKVEMVDLERWHDKLYEFDMKAKSGGIAPDVAVDLLVGEMVSSR